MVVADFGYCSGARLQNVSRDLCCCLERKALTRKMERKNIKEEGKEGRWENQKKICFSSLTHTHLCLRHGAHTSIINIYDNKYL